MSKDQAISTRIWLVLKNYTFPIFVSVYQLIALVALVAAAVLAGQWLGQPFLGSWVEQTLVLSRTSPAQSGSWELYTKIDAFGYQIKAFDGQAITDVRHLDEIIAQHQRGDTVTLVVDNLYTPENEAQAITVTLQSFSLLDSITYFYLPYLIALVYIGVSLWVFSLRAKDPTGLAFSAFSTSSGLIIGLFFEISTTHHFTYLWTAALCIAAAALINLTFVFPREERWFMERPYLRRLGYVPAIALLAAGLPKIYQLGDPLAYVMVWRLAYIFGGLAILFFVAGMVYRTRVSPSPIVREQTRMILLFGVLPSFGPVALWFLLTTIWPNLTFVPYLLIFTICFPLVTAVTILRYRLLTTDYLVSRIITLIILSFAVVAGYALLVSGFTLLLSAFIPHSEPWAVGVVAFLLALLFYPLRARLTQLVDSLFARGRAAYQDRLQSFGRELTRFMELPHILDQLRIAVEQNLAPTPFHIFVYDPLSDQYMAWTDQTGRPTSDLRFASNSALVQTLANRRTAIFLGEGVTVPVKLQSEHARLALLGARLFVPLPGRQRLAGWLALGIRTSGEAYTSRDLDFLEALCDQAALAVERAQVIADLERRVHEMNVLTRVSQGINITLAFDDILELIYAQTNQILHTVDFRITLRDAFSGMLYHVFYLENDERLRERENRPLPAGQGLEREVIRGSRQIVTDDYERECRSRGVLPSAKGIYAWVSVPLNAGAESIGVISVGSRDPSFVFTTEQVNLLHAIADQAAGAIVKARLLQESERRTRQLTILNEVARSLTSTLELNPLLDQILHSAVEILNCEAGSLLLVDPQTDELVFEVVIGPESLLGQRLPPGAGLVGKAVQERQPIIANDARRTKEWFDKADEETGFTTKDLLVVPMQVKDRVIGVIEIINRKDGLPFTPDDQELLSAFTSQAAVAIENARLYMQTDQTLAARVEELSVMQRIDRELNASLEVERAMRITLEWAMRQSKVTAGLIGIVEPEGVRIVASQGYTAELEPYREAHLPLDLPGLAEAIQTGQPKLLVVGNGNPAGEHIPALLASGKSRLSIPIRQENQAIGVLLLESAQVETVSEEVMGFLSRLTDHAAIAIANSRLYSEVQEANLAKSRFVSFVAHELKNPMASIKGYTELVAGGMAGPINEMQASFLATVRSNVDRMNTIVSDLNDLTKIQVGAMRLEFKSVEIPEVVDEVVRSLTRQLEEKQQRLVFQLQDSLPEVWADRIRVVQILTNLFSNAHKYTPQGGQITIGAELTTTEAESAARLQMVHLWVQDTGVGIPPEDQKKVFQQYFRTEISKEMASGTGLGLSITKSLVEMQGGRIWFESELQKGTTFHFTLPVAEAA